MAVYAFSDIHGRLNLLQQIQDFLKPDDKVYFLGDTGDRGPESWKTIKEIAKDNRMIYIKGNHEDMLVNAMEDYLKHKHIGQAFVLLAQNGGEETFSQWRQEKSKSDWCQYLKKLPLCRWYTNQQGIIINLSHAGFNPFADGDLPEAEELLWNRTHFLVKNPIFDSNEMVIHGHTPIPLLIRSNGISPWEGGAFWYANSHKVDLDCCSVVTGKTVLLDLDTFDEHIFVAKKEASNYD